MSKLPSITSAKRKDTSCKGSRATGMREREAETLLCSPSSVYLNFDFLPDMRELGGGRRVEFINIYGGWQEVLRGVRSSLGPGG